MACSLPIPRRSTRISWNSLRDEVEAGGEWGANGIRARSVGARRAGGPSIAYFARGTGDKARTPGLLSSLRCARNDEAALGRDFHIFEIAGLVVDADPRRSDPAREFAGLDDLFHQ